MPNKEQLQKKAWEWALNTNPDKVTEEHIETVYRVKLKPCSLATCRKNCKGNPHCLSGLGSKPWMQTLNYDNSQGIPDPNLERRQNSFVGLKNLGATCYVNSFLQVWYHNPAFRKAIYQWKNEKPDEIADIYEDAEVIESALSSTSPATSSAYIHHLQLTFALLQFSSRRYIDPSPFINSLGLNANQQQDAQEFSKLFTANLEAKLSVQTNSSVRDVVQELYSGEYAYITRCNHCSSESSRPSRFYELDLNIKGHKDLYECLEEFLKEENLVGPNQYFCDTCQCKRDAVRLIRLVHLPPFLNLQLLRFMFDRQTNRKKKLNSTVNFPEVLDMSRYLRGNTGSVVYDLCAVLIHCGQSAYSGHYVAHIRDRVTGSWYKFNDEAVEKMESNKLQLGSEEAPFSFENSPKLQKTPKLQKGQHGSNCAYMLVYKLRKENEKEHPPDTSLDWDLPEFLQNAVAIDNNQFEEWVKEMNEMRETNMALAIARQKEINTIFNILPAAEDKEFEFLNTGWITKWLNSNQPLGTEEIPPIDHISYLCPHGKLNPDNMCKVKCVSSEAADLIFAKYSGGPRLRNALCRPCVERRCEAICLKNRLQTDQKRLSNLLKCKITESEDAYWVGKLSLRNWRKLALQKYQDLKDIKNDAVCDGNASSEEQTCNTFERCNIGDNGNNSCGNNHKSADEDQENETLQFNEDACCEHNDLNADESSRKLVVPSAWEILKTYFPRAPVFSKIVEPCLICMQQVAANKKIRSDLCTLAVEQKVRLSDLYRDRSRPTYYKVEHGSVLYIVGKYFVDEWRKFVRDPQRGEPVTDLMNSQLLCVHGLLLYSPQLTDDVDPKSCLVLVSQEEWDVIKRLFIVDREIRVTVVRDNGQEPYIVSHPSVCEDCYAARMKEEAEQELQFNNAKIYVRRVSKIDDVDGGEVVVLENPVTNNKTEASNTLEEDPDFIQTVKKQKTEEGVGNLIPLDTHRRRSTRKSTRRTRSLGEKEIIISSTTTLLKLKLEIMNIFGVGTYDQHLFLNGNKLVNNDATMASLNVLPYSQILLQVDEARDFSEDYIKGGGPETGFEGTELMKN